MKTLFVFSSKRCFNQYPELIKTKDLYFYDANNILKKNHKKRIKYEFNLQISLKRFFRYYLDFIYYYKRQINTKPILIRKFNIYFFVFGLIGYLPYKLKPLIEYLASLIINKFIEKKYRKELLKFKLIIFNGMNIYEEFIIYLFSKKYNIETWFLPDGYDSLRKSYMPLSINRYFSLGEINDHYYKKYSVNKKLIHQINYPNLKISRNNPQKVSLIELSLNGNYNREGIINRLYKQVIKNFPNKEMQIRKLFNSTLSESSINSSNLNHQKKIKFKNCSKNYFENYYSYEFDKGNKCYKDFISETRILFLNDLSHVVLDFYLSGVPVILIYDGKTSNINLSRKKDYIWEVFCKNNFAMLTYEEFSCFKSIEKLTDIALRFKLNNLINTKHCEFVDYLSKYLSTK